MSDSFVFNGLPSRHLYHVRLSDQNTRGMDALPVRVSHLTSTVLAGKGLLPCGMPLIDECSSDKRARSGSWWCGLVFLHVSELKFIKKHSARFFRGNVLIASMTGSSNAKFPHKYTIFVSVHQTASKSKVSASYI